MSDKTHPFTIYDTFMQRVRVETQIEIQNNSMVVALIYLVWVLKEDRNDDTIMVWIFSGHGPNGMGRHNRKHSTDVDQ